MHDICIYNLYKKLSYSKQYKIKCEKSLKKIGFGEWQSRQDWPYRDITVESSNISILGIVFAHDITDALEMQWVEVISKIKQYINMLKGRNLTLFQRAIIINAKILSKVWYIAHTYPLPVKYSKLINKEIFGYLWLSKLNPIKRDVVYQSKLKGGLEIYNVFYKCQSIFTSTFLKHFLYSEENESMIKFYCALRVNPIFNIRDLPNNVSYNCPQFLDQVISTIRNATHIKTFPNIRSIDIYNYILPETGSRTENIIHLNWKNAWKIPITI